MTKNKLDLTYEIKIDTTLTLKLNVDGLFKKVIQVKQKCERVLMNKVTN